MKTAWKILFLIGLFLAPFSAFAHDWRIAQVVETGDTAVTDTGHRVNVVTVLLLDDSDAPWKRFVVTVDSFDGRATKADLSKGSKFLAFCNVLYGGTVKVTYLQIQFKDQKGHKHEEIHNALPDRSDSCE